MRDEAILTALESLRERIDLLVSAMDRPDTRYLTVANAAAYTDLSVESIRRLIASRKLTALRPVRGRVLIDRLELDTVVRSSTTSQRTGRGKAIRA